MTSHSPEAGAPHKRLSADERRAELERVAEPIFAERGFRGASTAEIAAAAGCSEALLYKLYPTKLALFAAVLGAQNGIRTRVDELSEELKDVEDTLDRAHLILRGCVGDPGLRVKSRLRAAAVTMLHEEPIRQELQASVRGMRARWIEIIGEAQERGYARRDVSAEQAGRTITSLLIAELLLIAIDPNEAGGKYDQLRTFLELLRAPDAPVHDYGKEPA